MNKMSSWRVALFYLPPVKNTRKTTKNVLLPKIRVHRIASTGLLWVGKCFVPLKFDALESLCRCLYGQNRFHTGFARVKFGRFLRKLPILHPLEITAQICYNPPMVRTSWHPAFVQAIEIDKIIADIEGDAK